jgi:tetratricopeptide (TPR) repeat protein
LRNKFAENRQRCRHEDPDFALAACTAMIQSGQYTTAELAAAFLQRGIVYGRKGEYDLALQDFDQVVRLKPEDPDALFDRGLTYGKKGDYDREIEDYGHAISLNPDFAEAFNNRGVVYNSKGEYDRAIQDDDRAVASAPDSDSFNGRCWDRAVVGQPTPALADCNEPLRRRPNEPVFLDSRGFTYSKMRKFDSAIADYNAALKLSPKLASSLYGRGLAEQAAGHASRSTEDISAAQKLDPKIVAEFKGYGVFAN